MSGEGRGRPVEVAGGITLDWRLWPVVVVTPPPRPSRDDELLTFMKLWERAVCARQQPYALVLDLRQSARMPPVQRKLLVHTMTEDALDGHCRCAAVVFSSALVRGMLTAMFWVWRPAYPTRFLPSVEEAMVWCQDSLAGLSAEAG